MKPIPFLLAASFVLLAGPAAKAQGHSNDKDKDKKEYKYKEKSDDDKGKKEYKYKEKDDDQDREKEREEYKGKDDDDRYQQDRKGERNERRPTPTTTRGKIGEILGRVILPPSTGAPAPRRLEGIPRGHYPPPGQCRVWYPNRPPGHQPSPTDCQSLAGKRLEPGAFILHGDQAYDAEYDWQKEETRRPGTVAKDVFDILFPTRR